MMKHNKLHELLVTGEATIGTHLFLPDPLVVEMVGHSSAFDYVEFVAECVSYDLVMLDNFCRAAELHELGTMIKIDWEGHRLMAQRAVGAGFDSVLFADAHSRADVEDCVRCVRADTPGPTRGLYGAAPRRHVLPDDAGSAEFVKGLDDVVVAVMIEKDSALKQLEAILQVPGVGLIQWGPYDYAMSTGSSAAEPGNKARLRKLERTIMSECQKAGVPVRAECGNLEDARYFADLGVRHFCYGWDLWTLYEQWRRDGEGLRGLLGEITDRVQQPTTWS
jgi:2-keto-3-deoxy-L-rhamnonate aldolase RhmA